MLFYTVTHLSQLEDRLWCVPLFVLFAFDGGALHESSSGPGCVMSASRRLSGGSSETAALASFCTRPLSRWFTAKFSFRRNLPSWRSVAFSSRSAVSSSCRLLFSSRTELNFLSHSLRRALSLVISSDSMPLRSLFFILSTLSVFFLSIFDVLSRRASCRFFLRFHLLSSCKFF